MRLVSGTENQNFRKFLSYPDSMPSLADQLLQHQMNRQLSPEKLHLGTLRAR